MAKLVAAGRKHRPLPFFSVEKELANAALELELDEIDVVADVGEEGFFGLDGRFDFGKRFFA